MIIDEELYLEHFGVAGMKWGVRKQKASGDGAAPKKQKQPLTAEQKQRRIQIGMTVLAGGVFVAKVLADSHNTKSRNARQVRALQDIGTRQKNANNIVGLAGGRTVRSQNAEKWLRQNKFNNVKVSDIKPPTGSAKKAGEMSNETKKWIADFTSSQNKLIREANGELRTRDNALQIPFAAREYLSEWT